MSADIFDLIKSNVEWVFELKIAKKNIFMRILSEKFGDARTLATEKK